MATTVSNSNGVTVGGGIANLGSASVTTSTFSSNSAAGPTGYGGGAANSGTLSVTDSTFDENVATGGRGEYDGAGTGGGIGNSGTLSLTNCTLSSNSATGTSGGLGGGIADSGKVSLTDVTVADNLAGNGGGIAWIAGSTSSVTSIDSIFQNPQGGNLSVAAGGTFQSLGHNLFSDTPSVSLQPSDLVDTDPLLGPRASNGGPTLTQALLTGSPAIGAGIAVPGVTTDQRGAPRPTSGATDIGAFQSQSTVTAAIAGLDAADLAAGDSSRE